jgi:hypothetical protein
MATIIDSLLVSLGIKDDISSAAPGVKSKLADLEKSAGKTEAGVKGIGTASKGAASELTVLTGKLGSFLAVLGGTAAVSAFVKDTIDTNTQLYYLSRNLEMNTQKLFAFGAAAQEMGGSKGSLQGFMRTIAGMPGELLVGKMPQLLPLFARLGINMREPFDQIMVDLSKRFAGMDRKVAFSFGMASGIPEDVMNLILQGPGAMQAAMGRTKGFGPTEKEAASVAMLKRSFTDIELQLTKIGYDLLYMVTPYLDKFLDLIQKIGAWAQRHEGIVMLIAGITAALAGVVAGTAAWIGLTAALEAAAPVIAAVAAAFGLIDLPILAVIGAVAALAAGIVLLVQDYKVWAEGGRSYFDWGGFAADVSKAKDAFEGLASNIERAVSSYGKWIAQHLPTPVKKAAGAVSGFLGDIKDRMEMVHQIASLEGFYAKGWTSNASGHGQHWGDAGNIPQRANNPADIEYGAFARSYGATGYIMAKGGHKIATFPDVATGYKAAYNLLGTKGYAGLSQAQTIARWQTGSSILSGVPNASRIPSSVGSSSSMSSSHTDNSRTTHIGTIHVQNPGGSTPMSASMARGMDWITLLTQQNAGLQ